MSEQIFPAPGGSVDGLSVNSFFGGVSRGPCLQFNDDGGRSYSQLTREQVLNLVNALEGWLSNTRALVPPDTEKAAAQGSGAPTSSANEKEGTQ